MFRGLSTGQRGKGARVLGAVLLATTAIVGIPANPAVAQTENARRSFNIPAQSLPQALMIFGRQVGLQVTADGSITSGKISTAVSGNLEPGPALERLLTGTGLTFRLIGDNGIQIEPVPPTADDSITLDSVRVEGTLGQGMGQSTENTGTYAAEKVSAGSKTPITLRETPQSLSVIASDLMLDKSMVTLGDALKLTPGVTVLKNATEVDTFMSRGFGMTNIQIDGASSINSSSAAGSFYSAKSYNLAQFDHVEVLRGASGLFLGSGDPGGAINLARKRPLDHYQLKFEAAAGSWNNYRTQLDLTGKITDNNRLRGRIVGEYAKQDFFYRGRSQDKPFVYGIVEADLSPRTMLTLGGSYEQRNTDGAVSGMPRYTDGRDIGLSRSTGWGQPWSYVNSEFMEAFAKIDHEISDNWKANASYTWLDNRTEALTSFILNPTDPVTRSGTTYGGSFSISDNTQHTIDVNLAGSFRLFGQSHDVVIGADYQDIQSRWRGAWGPSNRGGAVNVFNPEATPWNPYPIDKAIWRDYQPNDQKQYAAYARIGIRLLDPLKLNLGGRLTTYSFKQRYTQDDEILSDIDMKEPTRFVPYGSLTYDFAPDWSVYASYAETFTPQQRLLKGPVGSGKVIEPMTGRTWEAGVKGELMDGMLNASAAVFHITRNGQGVLDPAYPQSTPLFAGQCCYINQGKAVSKGVDIEVTGEVAPGLQLIAGYTYNHTEDRTTRKIFSSITPKHIGKLWATWQLPDAASRWKIGGGVLYQSASYTTGTVSRYDGNGNVVQTGIPFEFNQDAYAVVDAMAEYRINDNLTLTGNIGNLFDKKYYAATGTTSLGNYYGEPRNWRLTLRGKF